MALYSTSPPSADALLRLRRVGKRYRSRTVIDIDSLDVFADEALYVAGDNGSGKSTLLRMLAGVTRPSYGRVVKSKGVRIVMAPQAGGLYPALTILENVDAIGRLFGKSPVADDRAVPGLYELGLNEFADLKVGELSGGYQRLATIAVAMAVAPSGLLLDEPFAALDPEKAGLLDAFLKRAKSSLRFMVMTGHADNRVSQWATRSAVCRNGKLASGGSA